MYSFMSSGYRELRASATLTAHSSAAKHALHVGKVLIDHERLRPTPAELSTAAAGKTRMKSRMKSRIAIDASLHRLAFDPDARFKTEVRNAEIMPK